MSRTWLRLGNLAVALILVLAACTSGGSSGAPAGSAAAAKGPIKIWYSNNAEEVAWGKAMVAAWNAAHADEKVTGAGDPGRQELRGGHRRGDHRRQRAVPGLQHRAGRGAAVPEAGRPGRARRLRRRRRATSRTRTGDRADQYKSPDGKFYQMPWKSNPVMIFYNKDLFTKAGLDPDNPPLATYDEFLATAQEARRQGRRAGGHLARADAASSSSPGSTSTRSTPRRPAASSWSRTARPRSTTRGRQAVGELLEAACTTTKLAPQGGVPAVTRSPTGRRPWRSSARGPSRSTRARSNWGAVPVPTKDGMDREQTSTPSPTRRTIGMYSRLQEPGDRLGRPEVRHQQGAGRHSCSTLTGQMPMRTDLPTDLPGLLHRRTRSTSCSPTRPRRTVEVPNVPELGRDLADLPRPRTRESVIFGKTPIDDGLQGRADKINDARQRELIDGRSLPPDARRRGCAGLIGRAAARLLLRRRPYVVFLAASSPTRCGCAV